MTGTEEQYRGKLAEATQTIERLHNRLRAAESRHREPIAVVGLGLRMPGGAETPAQFWSLLRRGTDTTGEFPVNRGDARAVYHPDPEHQGTAYVIRGAFLDEVDGFDPAAFGISPREAVGMDPQQRIVLEVAWEALERAGYAPTDLGGSRTGVYLGLSTTDYVRMRQQLGDINDVDGYQLIGEPAFAAGRVSYTLGLQGPSQVVDTTCSSSLVALHEAMQALRRGECDMALAGGVNLMLSPYGFVIMSKFRALAGDGRCKTFDASADGYARGEGAAIVVLKRMADAIADRDTVLAVVRGSAVNHDGRSSGLTVPNPQAQQDVIRRALQEAGVAPRDVGYLEAHGTGTSLGDPIELRALDAVLGEGREQGQPLLVGSVKTNIGHLEPAAGIAGLAKVILALQHREIPPHLNLATPNPKIPWRQLRLQIPTTVQPWPRSDHGPIAAVSSFGASGTNAHLIVAAPEPQNQNEAEADNGQQVLTLSARSPQALRELAGRYAHHLIADAPNLADTCYTSQVGRARHPRGLAVTGKTPKEMAAQLTAYLTGAPDARVAEAELVPHRARKMAWLLTGQGSQYQGMAAGLREKKAFREPFDECAELMDPLLPRPLADVLSEGKDEGKDLDDTRYTQPALFAVEYALGQALLSWGVRPAAMLGHSVGEITAACLAGVLDLKDAVKLVTHRARLMADLPPGGVMVAVSCNEAAAREAIAGREGVTVAAVNGPADVVLSGPADEVKQAAEKLAAAGTRTYPLTVSHAFHSPLMDPMLDEFGQLLSDIEFHEPSIPLISNVTGEPWTPAELDPHYWVRHVASTVRFHDGLQALYDKGIRTFVEVGPQPVLTGLGRRAVDDPGCAWIGLLRKGRTDLAQLLGGLGALHLRGCTVDWPRLHAPATRRRVAGPTYPWQRERYWFRPALVGGGTARGVPGLGHRIPAPHPSYQDSVPDELATAADALAWLTARSLRAAEDGHGGKWRGLRDARVEPSVLHEARPPWLLHTTAEARADGAEVVVSTIGADPQQDKAGEPWRPVGTITLHRTAPPPSPIEGDHEPVPTEGHWQSTLRAAADALAARAGRPGWTPGFDTAGCTDITAVRQIAVDITSKDDEIVADVSLQDQHGAALGDIRGLRYEPVPAPPAYRWHPETDLLYHVAWIPETGNEAPNDDERVLLLAAEHDHTATALADALRGRAIPCQHTAPDNDLNVEDIGNDPPTRIVLSALDLPATDDLTTGILNDQVFEREQLAVRLIQTLAARTWPSRPPQLAILTRGAVATQATTTNVAHATLWGLGRTIALEHPQHWTGLIDLDPAGDDDMAAIVRAVLGGTEDQVALRPAPLVPRLRPQPALPDAPSQRTPGTGTVLITGGWGGIGSALALWLARHGTQRLVLVGRTPMPEEHTEAGQQRIDLVRKLRALGAEVESATADITDPDAVRALVQRTGPVNGVIHAAGVSGPQDLVDCDPDTYRGVWAPKTLGAWLLHEHTKEKDLDFFVCFSSIAATWGSQHLASYSAGNAFLDALAQHRHHHGLPALTVAWGPWGLASHLFENDVMSFLESLGLRQLHPGQCLALLGRMLANQTGADKKPNHVVCAADWDRYKPMLEAHGDRPMLAEIATAGTGGAAEEQTLLKELADPKTDRHHLLTGYLRAAAADVLRVDPATVTPDTDLFTLGLDSLMVMEVVNRCRRGLGVNLRPSDFFTSSSLDAWAARLNQELSPETETQQNDDSYETVTAIAARSRLPEDIKPAEKAPKTTAPSRVLLTGATGFVGAHLLNELLTGTEADVACLVRCPDPAEGLARIRANAEKYFSWPTNNEARIQVIQGDLARPGLGLTDAEQAKLADTVDEIYHAGAWVNFAHTFDQLHPANVEGTTELLRLAAQDRPKRFNLISTYGIWGLPVPGRTKVLETDDITTAGRLVTGYVQTKWGAEHLARQARDQGLDIKTFRLGRVLGDSRTGACLTTHFTCRVIKGCIQLGLAPDLGDLVIEMTPVDYVARALVHLSGAETGTYHLINPRRMQFKDLVAFIQDRGWPVNVTDRQDWWQKLQATEAPNELHPAMDTVREFIVGGEEAIDYDVTRTEQALAGSGIECPPLDTRLLGTYFDYFIRSGYIRPPGGNHDGT